MLAECDKAAVQVYIARLCYVTLPSGQTFISMCFANQVTLTHIYL